jgi:acetyl-CoA acetyltransferase
VYSCCSCRQTQDEFAAASHRKAAAAQAAGKFQAEIVPVHTKVKDPKSGSEQQVTISADDGIRPGTTAASLSGLRTVFKKDGTTTAGNSSQVRVKKKVQKLPASDDCSVLGTAAERQTSSSAVLCIPLAVTAANLLLLPT